MKRKLGEGSKYTYEFNTVIAQKLKRVVLKV